MKKNIELLKPIAFISASALAFSVAAFAWFDFSAYTNKEVVVSSGDVDISSYSFDYYVYSTDDETYNKAIESKSNGTYSYSINGETVTSLENFNMNFYDPYLKLIQGDDADGKTNMLIFLDLNVKADTPFTFNISALPTSDNIYSVFTNYVNSADQVYALSDIVYFQVANYSSLTLSDTSSDEAVFTDASTYFKGLDSSSHYSFDSISTASTKLTESLNMIDSTSSDFSVVNSTYSEKYVINIEYKEAVIQNLINANSEEFVINEPKFQRNFYFDLKAVQKV